MTEPTGILYFITYDCTQHTGDLSRVYPASHPTAAVIGSSSPVTINRMKRVWKMDGMMDGYSTPAKYGADDREAGN